MEMEGARGAMVELKSGVVGHRYGLLISGIAEGFWGFGGLGDKWFVFNGRG
jgi:hypothetical protein